MLFCSFAGAIAAKVGRLVLKFAAATDCEMVSRLVGKDTVVVAWAPVEVELDCDSRHTLEVTRLLKD